MTTALILHDRIYSDCRITSTIDLRGFSGKVKEYTHTVDDECKIILPSIDDMLRTGIRAMVGAGTVSTCVALSNLLLKYDTVNEFNRSAKAINKIVAGDGDDSTSVLGVVLNNGDVYRVAYNHKHGISINTVSLSPYLFIGSGSVIANELACRGMRPFEAFKAAIIKDELSYEGHYDIWNNATNKIKRIVV